MAENSVMDTDVLVVGGGPVGLTAALELRRRGIDVIVLDRLIAPAPIAKAVGIQPRTVELWDSVGIARRALDAATALRGMIAYVNGAQTSQFDIRLPDTVPYQFAALPQYETERVIAEALAELGTQVQRGTEFVGLSQSETGVVSTIREAGRESTIRSRYVIGCDGAHSTVRGQLGLAFEGDAFPEEYMLADVEVDWDIRPGYSVRASHMTGDKVDDLLVCIPLPGRNRYRMSMLVPAELSTSRGDGDTVGHGLEGGRAPELRHIQAVLDRLSPQPTTAANMRWSSVFRISHRIVDRYAVGRVFVAGDAAHIHPPTGAQGMNTGVQDAFNLGWKVALAVRGAAAEGLLSSYDDERRPVGEEVVGRTVRAARSSTGVDDDAVDILAREAQLLVAYPDSPLVADDVTDGSMEGGPVGGSRAPDARGLSQDTVSSAIRLHELLRHPGHTLLLWARTPEALAACHRLAEETDQQIAGHIRHYVIVGRETQLPDVSGSVFRDRDGEFATAYATDGVPTAAYLIRPDGYVGYRSSSPTTAKLGAHLRRTFS
jgi:2-polyprenyl-6-methoxyphenol hydroxylase-like FAD-dependent oxidoreductase